MTIDLPPAPNPEAIATQQETAQAESAAITKAEPVVAEPAIVKPTVPGSPIVDAMPPELELIDQLWSAYRDQLAASLDQQAAAVELAEYQKKYDAAIEKTETKKKATAELLNSFLDRLAAIRDPKTVEIVNQIRESVATEPVSVPQQLEWETYLKVPTQLLVDQKIEGLGSKKAEKLLEEFPTIKHLMDAKTEASKEHVHFCKKLGKGFGEVIGDKITEVMDDILFCKIPIVAKEPVPKKVAPTKPVDESAEGEPDSEPSTEPESYSDEPEVGILGDEPAATSDPESDDWENPHDDDSIVYGDVEDSEPNSESDATWAEQYLNQVRTDPHELKVSWGVNDKEKTAAWSEGHTAQEAFPVESCPYDEGSEEAKQWIRGYCAADAMAMDL